MLSPLLSSHWDRSQHLLEIQLLVCKTYRAQLDLEDVGVQCRCSVFKTSPELGVIQTWADEGLGKLTLWLPSRQRLCFLVMWSKFPPDRSIPSFRECLRKRVNTSK